MIPEVSIICNIYNQADYIRSAIDGFLMQETNFSFEILIHDDASTDASPQIIKSYEKQYPDKIKPIYQKTNQYSQGILIDFMYQFPRAKGKYIALCEGDDYWIDKHKLQKQYDALEAHPEIGICAHSAQIVDPASGKITGYIQPSEKNLIFTPQEVITGGGGFVATASLFMRKSMVESFPKFVSVYFLDYSLQIACSLPNGLLYLADCMSAYRYMSKGSWSVRRSKDIDFQKKHNLKTRSMLAQLNEDTKSQYSEVIGKVSLEYEFQYNILCLDKNIYLPKFHDLYMRISLNNRIKLRIKVLFPWLYRFSMLLK